MKKVLFVAAIILCSQFSILHSQESRLHCTFNGLGDGVKIVVNEGRGGRMVPTDTLTPDRKGRLSLKRTSADPVMLVLNMNRPQSPMVHALLLPNEEVTLTIDYMPALNFFNITSAKGSENMTLYKDYTNLVTDLLTTDQSSLIGERLEQLLDAHPGVLMSAFIVTFFEQQFDQYAPLYKKIRDALVPTWPENEFVRHLDSRLRAALVAGMEAPDIALPDPDGNIRRLSDLRGKVVLIDFWASWCRPCRMESPNVVRAYKAYHDKGFEVFSVSLDQKREAWLQAIEADHLDWPNHVSDLRGWSSAGGRLYGIQSIPATVLVGPDGKILARNLRGQELESKLKEIFNKE